MTMKPKKKASNLVLRRMIIFGVVFFICLFGFGAATALIFLNDKNVMKSSSINIPVTTAINSTPINILTVITDTSDAKNAFFTLIRLDFKKTAIPVTAIPSETIFTVNDRTDTLASHMNYGGVRLVKEAVEKGLGIKIDRYAALSSESYEDIINKLGGLNYIISDNLKYTDKSGTVITSLEKGNQNLNGSMVLELLRYPAWQEGRTRQVKTAESVTVNLLNQYATATTVENSESLFNYIINLVKSDLSTKDYFDAAKNLNLFSSIKQPSIAVSLPGEFKLEKNDIIFTLDNLAEFIKNYK